MHATAQVELMFVGFSILIIALELPLAMNRVKPNGLYGFRFPQTLADKRVWYLVNSYVGRLSVLTGIAAIVLAVALPLTDISAAAYGLACAVVFVGGLMAAIVAGVIYMRRIS